MNKTFSAYLETGRASNLPTVICNVFVAWAITGSTDLATFALVATSACLIYLGGCFLGDVKDVAFDTKHKPQRPIPAGVLKKNHVLLLALCMMILGTSGYLSLATPKTSTYIVISLFALVVHAYSQLHKLSPLLGLPLIGLCRGFLIAASIVVFNPELLMTPQSWITIICVTFYTICFASVARTESSSELFSAPNLLKGFMLALGAVPLLLITDIDLSALLYIITYLIYAVWLLFAFKIISVNKGIYVSRCLAGFAILDMVLISSTGATNIIICGCLFLTAFTLQRICPAT